MNEKDFIKKLEEFVAEVNNAVDSYISSQKVLEIRLTFRIRSIIKLEHDGPHTSQWIFKDEATCEKIHSKLKELLVMREMLSFKKQLEEEKK